LSAIYFCTGCSILLKKYVAIIFRLHCCLLKMTFGYMYTVSLCVIRKLCDGRKEFSEWNWHAEFCDFGPMLDYGFLKLSFRLRVVLYYLLLSILKNLIICCAALKIAYVYCILSPNKICHWIWCLYESYVTPTSVSSIEYA